MIKKLLQNSVQNINIDWAVWSSHKDFKQTVSDADMVYVSYHTNGKFDPQYAVNVRDYTLILRNLKLSRSYSIDFEEMIDGLNILSKKYPEVYNKLNNDKLDSETCDAFLQCIAFGEIVYN